MAHKQLDTSVWDRVVSLCTESTRPLPRRILSSDKLSAIKRAGTSHIYADTADYTEIEELPDHAGNTVYREIDGNTVNQPLVHKVIDRYLAQLPQLEGSDLGKSGTFSRKSPLHFYIWR
jgi:transaldolase